MNETAYTERRYTIDRGNMSDAQYIAALLQSNAVLYSENRRLVRLRLTETLQQQREARNCAKCLIKMEKNQTT
jgi:hypothetical protein